MIDHRPGCPARPGYGVPVEFCTCGAEIARLVLRDAARARPDVARLLAQAHDIEEVLRLAGIGSCTLPEGVRRLAAWKDAIIDACVVDGIFMAEHETNPRQAVNDLLCWQQKMALDPAISKDAADLHAQIAERQWQPIETAPKMRTLLLFAVTDVDENGRVRNWKTATGAWHTGYEDERSKARGFTPWEWDGHQLKSYDVQPTHWMTLPEPPP